MPVSAFGINHKTASVEVREKVAFDAHALQETLSLIRQVVQLDEVAILSTCNRMEVYFKGDAEAELRLKEWMINYHSVNEQMFEHCAFHFTGLEAVQHVMRVACGLDSMVLGEPQILGQMKVAFQDARSAGTLGPMLDRLFQHTFSVAKKVRTDTEIGGSAVSVAYAAVTLAKKIFSDLSDNTVLFIGAGETIELAARHFVNQGVQHIIVANRTLARADEVARIVNGHAITLQQIPEYLAKADIVISSTASPLPIVGKGLVEESIKQRKHKPMFMVDLAVPRDIEAAVGQLGDVYLYTVDDLKDVIEDNLKARTEAAEEAEDIVVLQSQHFLNWVDSLEAIDLVKAYRDQNMQVKEQEIQRAIAMLQSGESPLQVIESLAHRLTNKLIHNPTQFLRKLDVQQEKTKAEQAKKILGLDSSEQ